MTISDYYKYSQLSALAYVNWRDSSWGAQANQGDAIFDADAAGRIPGSYEGAADTSIDTLGEKIFIQEGWRVADFHPNDPSGFKASFFTNSATGEKVLAICGTEPTEDWGQDLKVDLQEIGDLGMAISQAVDLYNYVQQLKAPAGEPVAQLALEKSYIIPPSGEYVTVSYVPPVYYSLVSALPTQGLGLLNSGDDVTITGHSLGGHLAALGKRLFPDLFDNVVTYNAPGFDPDAGISLIPGLSDFVSLGYRLKGSEPFNGADTLAGGESEQALWQNRQNMKQQSMRIEA